MKESNICDNLILIRIVWGMNRAKMGQLFNCTEKQMGYFERGTTNIPLPFIFLLEDMTGILAKRLYYEALTRSSIPNEPLNPSLEIKNAPPQYILENLSLAERVRRLEMKVFGA